MFADLSAIVEPMFKTAWEALHPTIPIVWDGSDKYFKNGKTHVDFAILPATSDRADLGDSHRLHRLTGFINVNIYVKKGTGTREAQEYSDNAADIFRDRTTGGVLFRSPVPDRIGESGGFFQYNVSVPFQFDKAYTDPI